MARNLLAPTAVEGGGTLTAPDFLESFSAGGEETLADQAAAAAPAAPAPTKKEEKTDGKTADASAGVIPAAVEQPVQPAAKPAAVDAPAAAAPVAKPGEAKPADEDEWPTKVQDIAKFKIKRKAIEEKLKGEITERDTKLTDLQKQLDVAKTTKPADDTATKAEIEKRDVLIKSLYSKIDELDVTQDDRFTLHFGKKEEAAQAELKAVLGDERAKAFKELMDLPDGEYKTGQLVDFFSGLNDLEKTDLGTVRGKLREISKERADAIKYNSENVAALKAERQGKAEQVAKQVMERRHKLYVNTLADLQDPQKGNPIYQPREGNEAWNTALANRIEEAKTLLRGQNTTEEQIIRAAFHAAAFPELVANYKADMLQKGDTITKLEAQVKALTAAQPAGGGSASLPVGSKAEPVEIFKPGMNPMEIGDAFARRMRQDAGV